MKPPPKPPRPAGSRSRPRPGRKTRAVLDTLRRHECRNVTFIAHDGGWPIVWTRARGSHVWDIEGRRYLDLTAAFGVAAAGHAAPAVVRAGQRQMASLLHAMGDVHPHALKGELARELSRLVFERHQAGPGKTLFTNSGFEAVEAALKTARLATGKPGIIAFQGAYHGLGYGALNATHRTHFRDPFRDQLREFARFLPFPDVHEPSGASMDAVRSHLPRLLRDHPIGAILVEPIQARGGVRVPPDDFLPFLRRCADEHGILLILDEIYTGFGRTGRWFASDRVGVVPDVVCLGKAMTGGFPLSACVGRASIMDDAWPESTGEAIHTSTFLGHPVGCAMALAQIRELRRLRLPARAERLGRSLSSNLVTLARQTSKRGRPAVARGVGLMQGLELRTPAGSPDGPAALGVVRRLLDRGFILLPEGPEGEVIGITPPLVIPQTELSRAIRALGEELAAC
ncbi:MAG: aspartate aminotransferase family protein [Verrucomicrobiae bacterium]|nr:aspartate aminotransferase family protein [Verrucomicrobiae bacterium]